MGLALASTLLLAACGGGTLPSVTPGGTITPLPPAIGDTTIQQVQDAAVKACSFVPTAQTVTGIIASFFPGGAPINQIVSTVVNGICNAIAPKNQMRRGRLAGPPTVGGVRVEGYFTR
jgi:predicted phage tail protein